MAKKVLYKHINSAVLQAAGKLLLTASAGVVGRNMAGEL